MANAAVLLVHVGWLSLQVNVETTEYRRIHPPRLKTHSFSVNYRVV